MVKSPSDFIGSVLGESEKKTNAILEAALGCVLVIDEAYGLHSDKSRDPYKVGSNFLHQLVTQGVGLQNNILSNFFQHSHSFSDNRQQPVLSCTL